MCTERI